MTDVTANVIEFIIYFLILNSSSLPFHPSHPSQNHIRVRKTTGIRREMNKKISFVVFSRYLVCVALAYFLSLFLPVYIAALIGAALMLVWIFFGKVKVSLKDIPYTKFADGSDLDDGSEKENGE